MGGFFGGRREVGSCSLELEGNRTRIDCVIFESWHSVDTSTTVRCGETGSCSVTGSVGISEQCSRTLDTSIESSIGAAGILGLKSQIKESTGYSVNWTRSSSISQEFKLTAPKCGRNTLSVYQLQRTYELTCHRKRRQWIYTENPVWDLKWKRSIVEQTRHYDALPDRAEVDPFCNCPDVREEAWHGLLRIQLAGVVGIRTPFSVDSDKLKISLPDGPLFLSFEEMEGLGDLLNGFAMAFPRSRVPEPLLFLSGLDADRIDAWIEILDEDAAREDAALKEAIMGDSFAEEAPAERAQGDAAAEGRGDPDFGYEKEDYKRSQDY